MKSESTSNSTVLNVDELKDRVHLISKENKINKWDLGASSSRDLSVQVDQGESKQLKASQRNSITIRVWNKDDLLGITSTSDLSTKGIRKAFEFAHNASNYGNKDEIPQFSKLSTSALPGVRNILRNSTGIDHLLEILKEAELQLINSHKSITSVPYNGLAEANIERLYINSHGAQRYMNVTQASLYLYAKAQEDGRKPRSSGSVKIGYGVEDLNIEDCINEASGKTISHLNYEPIKTDKYLICFTPEAFIELIGSFSSMFNARSILDGLSLTKVNTLDQNIAVPFLSISDQALHPKNIASFTFDGEGTPKRNVELIKDGKIFNLLHSESTARRFNVSPTGHAGMGSKASVSPDWLVISNQDSKLNTRDLHHTKTNQTYVLIEGLNALHAGVKASQGSFSLPFDGWLVENGTKKSIESATIAGDIRYLLKNILAIEKEDIETPSGISPHVWVDNLSVTGE